MADDTTSTQGATSQSSSGQGGQSTQATGAASGAASSQTQGSTQATQQTSQQTTAPSRPDWLPEQYFDPAKGPKLDDFGKHYSELATRDAAEQIRRAALPQKPDDVKVELPKEFQLPQGVEFKIDPAKPEFAKLRDVAVKHGISQDAVTDLVGVYAETLVGSEATLAAARAAEVAKLGANGPARITALQTWLTGMVGESDAKQLQGMLVTAGIVQAYEKLVSKFVGQGAAGFSQAHRDVPQQGGRINEEQYRAMSPAARLDYARQFPQDQMPEWRDPRAA